MWTEKKIESERDSGQAKQGDPKRQLVRPTISVLKAFARVVRGRHRFYRADLAILASHLYRGGQQISALSRKSPLGEAVATRARPGKVGFHRCATSVEIAGDEKWYEDWYLNDISKNALVSIASSTHTFLSQDLRNLLNVCYVKNNKKSQLGSKIECL